MVRVVGEHLDLFSGIGGFAIAAQACGFRTVAFCEIEPYAQQILVEKFGAYPDAECLRKLQQERRKQDFWRWLGNMGGENGIQPKPRLKRDGRPMLHSDIFALNGADYRGVTLLTGGFPCQPYSFAGKRRGAADDRALWPEMLRVIDEARPTWVLGENVAGIITMELDRVLLDLESIGYACWPLVIPACAVDARHRRDRVWIVGHATSEQDNGKRRDCELRRNNVGWNLKTAWGCDRKANNNCSCRSSEDVADAQAERLQGQRSSGIEESRSHGGQGLPVCCSWPDEADWFAQSGMGRVSHGIPNRAHRLRGLGNAIVPQVAEEIIRAIALNYGLH